MVNENLIKLIENKKSVELVQELKDYEIKKSPLSPAARSKVINKSGGNYQSLRATINNPSYGPGVDSPEVKKYCSSCRTDREVSSGDNYCPNCARAFGTVVKKTSTQRQADANSQLVVQHGGKSVYTCTTSPDGTTTETAFYQKD